MFRTKTFLKRKELCKYKKNVVIIERGTLLGAPDEPPHLVGSIAERRRRQLDKTVLPSTVSEEAATLPSRRHYCHTFAPDCL